MRHIVHVSGYALAQHPQLHYVVDREGQPATGKFGDWEHVCWGDPSSGALGRIPTALWYARQVAADRLVWSTGCQRIKDGAWEAEFFFERAMTSFERLQADFPHRFGKHWFPSSRRQRSWLGSITALDTESTITSASMEWLARYVRKEVTGAVTVHLISSANHVPRVLRDAMKSFNYDYGEENFHQRVTLIGVPAETNYGRKWVHDVVIRDLGD